jgi:hypothetical protein
LDPCMKANWQGLEGEFRVAIQPPQGHFTLYKPTSGYRFSNSATSQRSEMGYSSCPPSILIFARAFQQWIVAVLAN